MVEQRRGRRDRIAAEEHFNAGKLAAGDETKRKRFGAGDGAVKSRLSRRGSDVVLLEGSAHLDRLAIGMAGVERGDVRLGKLGRLCELGVEPVDDRLAVGIER